MISGYDYDCDYIYIYIYIYISIYIYIYIYIYLAQGCHWVYTAKPDGAPTGNPPPAWEGALHKRQPPRPPSAPAKKGTPARRVGDIVPCRAAMNRHGPTPGDTRPPPPLAQEGHPSSPGHGATRPPPHHRRGGGESKEARATTRNTGTGGPGAARSAVDPDVPYT